MNKDSKSFQIISEIITKCNNHKQMNSIKNKIFFDLQISFDIIQSANDIFEKEPAVLNLNTNNNSSKFVVVGDLHGSIESLIRIFNDHGYPPLTKYLFLGDYVDRGNNSSEVIILLYALKCVYPNDIYLIRGNHEFAEMNENYGFKNECLRRINEDSNSNENGLKFYASVVNSFQNLPICAILDDSIFCVHGGISSQIENRQQLYKIEKAGFSFSSENIVQNDFLWNDPSIECLQYEKSPRGIGSIFGDDALDQFLEKMNFTQVIRSHQNYEDGFDYPFGDDGKIVTIFSSLDYCGTLNDAAVCIFNNDENGENFSIHQFSVLPKVIQNKIIYHIPEEIIRNDFARISFQQNLDFEIPNLIEA